MDLDKVIKSRRSIKEYKAKKPDWRPILEAIDTAKYAPCAGNIFTLKFILVDDPKKIEQIGDACQQNFVKKAQYVVVVCSNPDMLIKNFKEKGKEYNKQQAGAALQNFLLKLEERGLSTCWTAIFVENMIRKTLKIPENIEIEAVFPIGIKTEEPKTRKIKIDLDNFMRFNDYKTTTMNPKKKIDV